MLDTRGWARREARVLAPPAVAVALGLVVSLPAIVLAAGVVRAVVLEVAGAILLVGAGVLGSRAVRARRHAPDDDVIRYRGGRVVRLVARTAEGLAEMRRADGSVAFVFARTWLGQGDARTIIAENGARRLWLQHRQDRADEQRCWRVRLCEGVPSDANASAVAVQRGDAVDWTLTARGVRLRFRARCGHQPRRRTLVDADRGHAYLATGGRDRLTFDGPPEMSERELLFVVWVLKLVDAHARTPGEPWLPVHDDWHAIVDDFPARVGPGGFGGGVFVFPIVSSGPGGVGGS